MRKLKAALGSLLGKGARLGRDSTSRKREEEGLWTGACDRGECTVHSLARFLALVQLLNHNVHNL